MELRSGDQLLLVYLEAVICGAIEWIGWFLGLDGMHQRWVFRELSFQVFEPVLGPGLFRKRKHFKTRFANKVLSL